MGRPKVYARAISVELPAGGVETYHAYPADIPSELHWHVCRAGREPWGGRNSPIALPSLESVKARLESQFPGSKIAMVKTGEKS